jgi:hypothetical protein
MDVLSILPTHLISGWFIGAHAGQEEGDLYNLQDPMEAQLSEDGKSFIIIENYYEVMPDGSLQSGVEYLFLVPGRPSPALPQNITPINIKTK